MWWSKTKATPLQISKNYILIDSFSPFEYILFEARTQTNFTQQAKIGFDSNLKKILFRSQSQIPRFDVAIEACSPSDLTQTSVKLSHTEQSPHERNSFNSFSPPFYYFSI